MAGDSEYQSKPEPGLAPTDVSTEEVKEGVGALSFEEYTTGGLGRHLGIFSTTSLMYVLSNDHG
jgi:hypothetical protein